MATNLGKRIFSTGPRTAFKERLCLSTSSATFIKWRFQKGVEPNPNRFGPLTNLPDYSFVDGRPVPLSTGLHKRLKLQEEYCKQIIKLSSEMDYAIQKHKCMEEESEATKKAILQSKLKPKGSKTS